MGAIDDVKDRLDIVDIIQENGVQLRRSGRSYTGYCPFHPNTRTPAFTVYPDTQSFYCFGCQASGTVFDFVMRKQGLDFREALQQLAPRANVQLKPRSEEEEQQDQQRTRLLALTTLAARYFNYLLITHERGEPGREYIARRDIDTETLEMFQLGYSLDGRSHLFNYLTERKDYTPAEVEAAGLAIFSEQYGYYDRFRGRLIFPIRSAKGEVVGFGGRALGDTQPKYLNTPQTLLFDKSQVLYGLDLARDDIRRTDAAVVVEGYIDVITAHQHGFRNVVAPLGTALNSNHVALLKKLSHNIYLALDADAAGQRATLRGLSAFEHAPDGPADDEAQAVVTAQGLVRWQRDITLRIITLPEGRDPDDVIKSDPQQWQSLIDNAQPVMDFYLAAYTADLDLDQPQQQHTALERLLPLLRQLDSTQQRVYVARLEQVIGIRAEIIIDLLRAAPPRPPRSQQRQRRDAHPRQEEHPSRQEESQNQNAPFPARSSASARREDYLLALLMRYPSVLEPLEVWLASNLNDAVCNLLGDSPDRLLDQTTNRIIWQTWREAGMPALVVDVPLPNGDESADPTTRQLPGWSAELDPALRGQLEHLVDFPLPQHPEYHVAQDAENCARYLRLEQARRWQRRLGQQAQDAEDSQERERLFALLGDVQRYLATINQPHRSKSWEDMRDTLRQPDEV